MFVSRSMTIKVVTIQPNAAVLEAQELMATHQIRHLPVIDGKDRLIGVVTDRDVRSVLPYDCYKNPDCTKEHEKVAELIPAQAGTIQVHLLTGVLMTAGCVVGALV